MMLADVDRLLARPGRLRFVWGWATLSAFYILLALGPLIPYAIIHDGLLIRFSLLVLGLAGENPLATLLGKRPLVFVGEASYSPICCTLTCGL